MPSNDVQSNQYRYDQVGSDQELNSDIEGDPVHIPNKESDPVDNPNKERDPDTEGRTHWWKAIIAFTMLKDKIAQTPIPKHYDPDRSPMIVVYASKLAVLAELLQEHDGVY